MAELVGVGPTSVELFAGGAVTSYGGLAPDSAFDLNGVTGTTLSSIGEVRARVATVNDVHFGEVECGKIDGQVAAQFTVGPGERPYPEVMNESVIADIAVAGPDLVVVKGDLTSFGTLAEYETFRRFYEPPFGDRLLWVRGNHDSYPGEVFADWSVQVRDVPGLRVVLLDTARAHEIGGFISDEQIAATVAAAREAPASVLVMGHHPLFDPDDDHLKHFDGVTPPDSAKAVDAWAALPQVIGYTAGHTHRCRRRTIRGLPSVEVACVKDFPGAWAEYLVGTTGVAQVVHRATGAAAIAWAERTRDMFDGYYGTYAMGALEDRCFVLPLRRDR